MKHLRAAPSMMAQDGARRHADQERAAVSVVGHQDPSVDNMPVLQCNKDRARQNVHGDVGTLCISKQAVRVVVRFT